MAKKDIGKILTTGTPRQRMLLIAEDIARGKYFQDKLLSDSDYNKLKESFRKPNEIKLWNEFYRLDDTVTNAIINLQGLLFEVKMHYSNLRGYILVWDTLQNTELLVNSVLHEIKDTKERIRIAEEGAESSNFFFCNTEPDQEGYLDIKVDFQKEKKVDKEKKRFTFWELMNNVKKEVETSVIKYLSWERAILDFIEERGFNVKTYKERIKDMGDQARSRIIWIERYTGNVKAINTFMPRPRLEELMKKYILCPNVEELQVDEAQYSWYRRYFLDEKSDPDELRGKLNKRLSDE